MTRGHTSAGGAILFILLLGCGEFGMVGGQYLAQFDGTVVARTEGVYYPFWTRNRVTKYVIRESDGGERVYYAHSSFPIGAHLSKQRWRLDYELDGKRRDDFPFPFYFFWIMFDLCLVTGCVIVGIMINIRDRRTRELEAAVERAREILAQDDRDS